jgi:hypothetical protein
MDDELLNIVFDPDEVIELPDEYVLDEVNTESVRFLKAVQKERKEIELKNGKIKEINIEISLNVNNDLKYRDLYEKLDIARDWIELIIEEFSGLKNKLYDCKKSSTEKKFQHAGDVIAHYKLYPENIKYITIPDPYFLSTSMTNKICLKLLSFFSKNYSEDNTILIWVYYLLAMIETPLLDEDNSILYNLNKNVFKSINKIEEKLLFVIISEIYGQKIIR